MWIDKSQQKRHQMCCNSALPSFTAGFVVPLEGMYFHRGSLRYPFTIFSGSHSENLLCISCVDTGLHPFLTGCKEGRNRLL